MTKEQIEGSRLICEFISNDSVSITRHDCYYISIPEVKCRRWVSVLQTRYHESWDWIMSVIEKIDHLDETEEFEYSSQVTKAYTDIMEYDWGKGIHRQVACGEDQSKLTNTWIAVVEFIKYYNEQKGIAKKVQGLGRADSSF